MGVGHRPDPFLIRCRVLVTVYIGDRVGKQVCSVRGTEAGHRFPSHCGGIAGHRGNRLVVAGRRAIEVTRVRRRVGRDRVERGVDVAKLVAAVQLVGHGDQAGALRRARARATDHIPTRVIDVRAVARVSDVNQHASPAARLEPDVGHPATSLTCPEPDLLSARATAQPGCCQR